MVKILDTQEKSKKKHKTINLKKTFYFCPTRIIHRLEAKGKGTSVVGASKNKSTNCITKAQAPTTVGYGNNN